MFDLIYVGNFRPEIGGAVISCHQLLCELARRGCRIRVLASMTDAAREETLCFDESSSELEIHRFPVPYYCNAPYHPAPDDWTEASRNGVRNGLAAMIADSAPEALLVNESWVPFTNEIAAGHGIPTIALVRGNPTAAILSACYPEDRGNAHLAELRKTDLIVTVAAHFLPGLSRLGFDNCRSIPNTVDLSKFSMQGRDQALARQFGITDSDVVVFHASRLTPIKRPLDIVRSAPAVLRGNPNVLYFILGEGSSRQEMQSLTEDFGVAARFRFHDFVEYEEMPRYMSLADVVVMPSEREGLARLYLEAQACGKTLVASDIPAAREALEDGESGLLFRRGDIADLTETILCAAADSSLRIEIGARARQNVQRHSILTVGEQYMETIREVLSETGFRSSSRSWQEGQPGTCSPSTGLSASGKAPSA